METPRDLLDRVGDSFQKLAESRGYLVRTSGADRHGGYEWAALRRDATEGLARFFSVDLSPWNGGAYFYEVEVFAGAQEAGRYWRGLVRHEFTVHISEMDERLPGLVALAAERAEALVPADLTSVYPLPFAEPTATVP